MQILFLWFWALLPCQIFSAYTSTCNVFLSFQEAPFFETEHEVLFTPAFSKFDFSGQHTASVSIKTMPTQLTVTDALIPTFIFSHLKNYLKLAHFQAIFFFSLVKWFCMLGFCV